MEKTLAASAHPSSGAPVRSHQEMLDAARRRGEASIQRSIATSGGLLAKMVASAQSDAARFEWLAREAYGNPELATGFRGLAEKARKATTTTSR